MKWKRSSRYRYCMCFSSKSTSSTFSPARKVLSMTRPCRMCLSLVRTKAPPLPGLTCWKSTILYGCPSNWIFRPFLNSAVETCIASCSLSSLGLGSQGLVEARTSLHVAWVLATQAKEYQSRIVDQSLLQAERAHARRHEGVVDEDAAEWRARFRPPIRGEAFQAQAGLTVGGVELDHTLKVLARLLPSPRFPMDFRSHPMRLHVSRARHQDDSQLGECRLGIAVVQMCLGQDQPRRRVVLEAGQAFPAQVDRLAGAPDLAVGIGERGKGQGGRIPHEALLVSSDGGRGHGILGDGRPATLGVRVRHPLPL